MSEPQASKTVPRRRPAASEGEPRITPPANLNAVGQGLRLAREQRGQKIEVIAEILKIRRVYLQAIEDADWASLPELVYAQGFVRSYADYLDLDGSAAVAQFKKEFRGGPRTPELDMPKPIEDNQTPDFKIIAASLLGLLVVFVLWSLLQPSRKSEPVPAAPSQTQSQIQSGTQAPVSQTLASTAASSNSSAATAAAPVMPLPSAAPVVSQNGTGYGAATQTRVTITATQDSWVQIRASDGQVVFSRVMRPGDYYRVPADAGLTLTTGNLSGLNFTVDGQSFSPNSTPGTVQRNLPLAAEGLPTGLAPFIRNSAAGNINSNVSQ